MHSGLAICALNGGFGDPNLIDSICSVCCRANVDRVKCFVEPPPAATHLLAVAGLVKRFSPAAFLCSHVGCRQSGDSQQEGSGGRQARETIDQSGDSQLREGSGGRQPGETPYQIGDSQPKECQATANTSEATNKERASAITTLEELDVGAQTLSLPSARATGFVGVIPGIDVQMHPRDRVGNEAFQVQRGDDGTGVT